MERKETEKNILKTQTQIFKQGEKNYNSLRNADITLYGKPFSLQDKKCLSMYLSMIYSENFFSELLNNLGYNRGFTNFTTGDITTCHYEDEFRCFVNPFESDIVLLILYLLDNPVIKLLNEKRGYSNWKIKLAVYDYLSEEAQSLVENSKNIKIKRKSLTNE